MVIFQFLCSQMPTFAAEEFNRAATSLESCGVNFILPVSVNYSYTLAGFLTIQHWIFVSFVAK